MPKKIKGGTKVPLTSLHPCNLYRQVFQSGRQKSRILYRLCRLDPANKTNDLGRKALVSRPPAMPSRKLNVLSCCSFVRVLSEVLERCYQMIDKHVF